VGGGAARFPLHLAYHLEFAGTYSIRLTGTHDSKVVVQSAWTDIEVMPFSQSAKDELLRSVEAKIESASWQSLVSDLVPSLLASPDEDALRILRPLYSKWLGPMNGSGWSYILVGYLQNSLAIFDDRLLQPFERVRKEMVLGLDPHH
jgi:hypothetical protein